ncbi:hemolysin III [Loktanella atrilutea]|uniref:Hemolysin III n=1 Tax=Loktanella atrilutea TaxID=366533 RepID=A0A1M4SZZ5_LOKAT|nr:hemolysin III family protein [Loktanella atrilutea]SHE37774.1 hemolysin III [Loktanella atrilutea]
MNLPLDAYPAYARSERIADGTLHALGVAFALAGAVVLLGWAARTVGAGQMTALTVYGVALIATFTASAFYHMTPWERLRPTLRRIDHAAIYLKIAGTFTPLAAMIGSGFAYGVLALVWAMAIWGMAHKLFFWQVPGRFGPALYLLMGWLGVLLIPAIASLLPGHALALLGAGGLLYTAGVIFFSWESLKFSNAIWHGFVLAASVCFFSGIFIGIAALA